MTTTKCAGLWMNISRASWYASEKSGPLIETRRPAARWSPCSSLQTFVLIHEMLCFKSDSWWLKIVVAESSKSQMYYPRTKKSIIEFWPRVFWYKVHVWTALCWNMVFANRGVARKSENKVPFGFRSGHSSQLAPRVFSFIVHTWVLMSCSRTIGSPVGALSRMPPRDSKKAAFSERLFSAEAHTAVRDLPLATHRCNSFPGENSNTVELRWRLMGISTPARHLSPWATPEKDNQPLSRSLLLEPVLCVKVSCSRRYHSTLPHQLRVPYPPKRWHPTSLELVCNARGQRASVPTIACHRPAAQWIVSGLCPCESHIARPSHQTLAGELPSQVSLQKGASFSLFLAGSDNLFPDAS